MMRCPCFLSAGEAHAAAFWMASQGHPVSTSLATNRGVVHRHFLGSVHHRQSQGAHVINIDFCASPFHLPQVPFGVSTPDHLLDLACGDLPGGKNEIDLHHLVKSFRSRTIGGCYIITTPI
jgi:hypothetical protein